MLLQTTVRLIEGCVRGRKKFAREMEKLEDELSCVDVEDVSEICSRERERERERERDVRELQYVCIYN